MVKFEFKNQKFEIESSKSNRIKSYHVDTHLNRQKRQVGLLLSELLVSHLVHELLVGDVRLHHVVVSVERTLKRVKRVAFVAESRLELSSGIEVGNRRAIDESAG